MVYHCFHVLGILDNVCALNFLLSVDSGDAYWIGKKTFQCWRRLYHMSNNSNEEPTQLAEEGLGGQPPNKTDDSPTTITSFNEDLLCCHGKDGCCLTS